MVGYGAALESTLSINFGQNEPFEGVRQLHMAMIKVIMTILVSASSMSAFADWANFGTSVTRDGNVTAYVNQSTIQKTGSKSKMWILYDAKTPRKLEALTYLSSMGEDEYDCEARKSRNLQVLLYSDKLGHGEVVSKSSTPSSDWEPVPPDSMGGHLLKYACGMK